MLVLAATVLVFVVFDDTMNGQIHTEYQEKYCTDMSEPFLKSLHLAGQLTDADSAVTNQPRDQHDGQTCSQTEHDWHQPVPTVRQSQRDINHRQEIDESVRAECNRKENT